MRVGSSRRWSSGPGASPPRRIESTIEDGRLSFADPEGLGLELIADPPVDRPLMAAPPGDPPRIRAAGLRRRARLRAAARGELGAAHRDPRIRAGRDANRYESRGDARRLLHIYDDAPQARGARRVRHRAPRRLGHHRRRDHAAGASRASMAAACPTPVIDRYYFHSIYFREPSGVLFEIADRWAPASPPTSPVEHLGRASFLPPGSSSCGRRSRPTSPRCPIRAPIG